MIRLMLLVALGVYAISMALPSFAEEKPVPEEFSKIDTDGDGKLSMEEFKKAFPGKPGDDTNERFKHADTNNDKYLSPDELNAAHGTAPEKSKSGSTKGKSDAKTKAE